MPRASRRPCSGTGHTAAARTESYNLYPTGLAYIDDADKAWEDLQTATAACTKKYNLYPKGPLLAADATGDGNGFITDAACTDMPWEDLLAADATCDVEDFVEALWMSRSFGETDHNKADCLNPMVERAFTGICRKVECRRGEMDHGAGRCPNDTGGEASRHPHTSVMFRYV
ncbi:hypothetical protein E4T48_06133 [Aureobasidium sp. EXF-10727]|nr:hypothetical protein E4T48_06133 [Aureobasidium sp. EXF-10727]